MIEAYPVVIIFALFINSVFSKTFGDALLKWGVAVCITLLLTGCSSVRPEANAYCDTGHGTVERCFVPQDTLAYGGKCKNAEDSITVIGGMNAREECAPKEQIDIEDRIAKAKRFTGEKGCWSADKSPTIDLTAWEMVPVEDCTTYNDCTEECSNPESHCLCVPGCQTHYEFRKKNPPKEKNCWLRIDVGTGEQERVCE